MKRMLVIGLGTVLLLAVALLGLALYNANRLVARFKPEIERRASATLGSPVELGNLEVSVLSGAHLNLDQLRIGGERGLTLRNLTLHLRLLPLLRGRLDLVKLGLDGPHLSFSNGPQGLVLEGLPARAAGGGEATTGAPAGAGTRAPVLALDLRQLEVRHGTFTLSDAASKTDLTLTDASVDAALTLDGGGVRVPRLEIAGTLADVGPLTLTGTDIAVGSDGVAQVPALTVDVAGSRMEVKGRYDTRKGGGQLRVVSPGIDLTRLAPLLGRVAPTTAALAPRGTVKPDVTVQLAPGGGYEATGKVELADVALDSPAGPVRALRGLLDLHATAQGTSATSRDLSLELAGKPIGVAMTTELAGDTVTLKDVVVTAFAGKTRVGGTFGLATQRFNVTVGAEGLDLGQVQEALSPGTPHRLTGTLARFQTKIAGTAGNDLLPSLTGPGSLLMKDARLLGVNLPGQVLRKVSSLPFVSRTALDTMPDDVRRAVEGPDTIIDSLDTEFTLGGAGIRLAGLNVASPGFSFEGGGRVGFDANLDLAGTVHLSPAVSRGIVSKTKELRAALDDRERLSLPLTIAGTAPKVIVVPDLTRLATTGAGKLLEEKAGKLLQDVLGGKKKKDKGKGGGLGQLLHGF